MTADDRDTATVGGRYRIIAANGQAVHSPTPGSWGGHRRTRIFGRLECRTARAAIARGGYVAHRVFFADAATAFAAGYRPCAVCCPDAYRSWKEGEMAAAIAERMDASVPS